MAGISEQYSQELIKEDNHASEVLGMRIVPFLNKVFKKIHGNGKHATALRGQMVYNWLEKQEQLYGRPIIFNLRYKEIAKILHNIEQHTDTSYHTNPLVYKGMEQLWKSCEQYFGQQMKEERRHKV